MMMTQKTVREYKHVPTSLLAQSQKKKKKWTRTPFSIFRRT